MKQMNFYLETRKPHDIVPEVVPLAYQAIVLLLNKVNRAYEVGAKVDAGKVKEDGKKADSSTVPLWHKYSLSVAEAARYFGIGEGRIYQIIAEHQTADFILEIGSHVKIKRVLFEHYLDNISCI